MKKKKLNKFIIISVAFHVVLISAILLYFLKNPISGGESGTVMIGVIGSQESANRQSAAEATEINKSKSRKEISEPKITLDKKQPEENIKNQKSTNITNTQKENPKIPTKETKQASQPKQVYSKSATENTRAQTTGKESASIGNGESIIDKSLGTQGSNNTLAYPDYNHNPKPKYPRVARKRGYEGEVKLNVFVLPNGKVGKIEVLRPSGYKILDEEAIEAVKSWIFIPGKQDGREISSWVTVPITFQLKSG